MSRLELFSHPPAIDVVYWILGHDPSFYGNSDFVLASPFLLCMMAYRCKH